MKKGGQRLRINVTRVIILKVVGGPIFPGDDGIVLKLEKMQVEELYHCVFDGIVYLFYKDPQNLLHCYEIGDKKVVSEIEEHPDDFKEIIKKYSIDIRSQ